jgi:hypothetical protein
VKKARILLAVISCVSCLFADNYFQNKPLNWNGWLDTSIVTIRSGSAIQYSRVFAQTNGENAAVIISGIDTTNHSGHKSDSIKVEYGYQVGSPYVNVKGSADTLWSNQTSIDTLTSDTLKIRLTAGYTDTGTYQRVGFYSCADTTKAGIWKLYHPLTCDWAPYIRFYYKPVAGIRHTTYCKVNLVWLKRSGVYVVPK